MSIKQNKTQQLNYLKMDPDTIYLHQSFYSKQYFYCTVDFEEYNIKLDKKRSGENNTNNKTNNPTQELTNTSNKGHSKKERITAKEPVFGSHCFIIRTESTKNNLVEKVLLKMYFKDVITLYTTVITY